MCQAGRGIIVPEASSGALLGEGVARLLPVLKPTIPTWGSLSDTEVCVRSWDGYGEQATPPLILPLSLPHESSFLPGRA